MYLLKKTPNTICHIEYENDMYNFFKSCKFLNIIVLGINCWTQYKKSAYILNCEKKWRNMNDIVYTLF